MLQNLVLSMCLSSGDSSSEGAGDRMGAGQCSTAQAGARGSRLEVSRVDRRPNATKGSSSAVTMTHIKQTGGFHRDCSEQRRNPGDSSFSITATCSRSWHWAAWRLRPLPATTWQTRYERSRIELERDCESEAQSVLESRN